MLNFFQYTNVIAIAFSIYCLSVAFSRGVRTLPMIFLFLSNAVLISNSIFIWLLETKLILTYPHYIRIPAPLHYLFGPSIYLFVRTLLFKEQKLKKWDWLHFLPFVIHFIELIPFYMEDVSVKMEMAGSLNNDYSAPMKYFYEGLLPSKYHTILKLCSWVVYIWFAQKTYLDFKQKIKSSLITDYNRKFAFINFFLLTKYVGFVGVLTAIFLSKFNSNSIFLFVGSNLVGIINVFVLIFRFPEMVYGEVMNKQMDNNREQLMSIVKTQTKNLHFLEHSSSEANILLDMNHRVLYFDKLGEVYFKKIYNRQLELGEDYTSYLDEVSLQSFLESFNRAIRGVSVRFEDKFLLNDGRGFIWMELNFTPHYTEKDQLAGVSIGATVIDEKKRMESLQIKYKESLDQLAWSSSHLLRAPVSNISGILQLMKDDKIEMSESEKKYLLNNIFSEVNKLDSVIKDMVATARKNLDN